MTDPLAQLSTALAGRYVIEREIGVGGMAKVYLARDLRHDRPVALKLLNPELGAVLGSDRFLSEIKVTANLQHPNLLPLFDSGEASGLLYYVMPFVKGESLRVRLDREKQFPIDEAVRIAAAVASALDYAHRHGVIHRDLKPENILLHEGQPLVADFGIALAVSNAGQGRITQTGLSLGTPQYMSPEQATGDRTIDGRTDVYSLGAVLYEMLVGDPPHIGSTSQAIIAKVITERPADVRISRPSVPDYVAYAVERALEKLPADRWATAAEFCDALYGKAMIRRPSTALGRETIDVRVVSSPKRRAAAAGSLVLVGALIGVGGWAALHRQTVEPPPAVHFELKLPGSAVVTNAFGPTIAISPDGKTIVYVGENAGRVQLYRRPLDQVAPVPVAGTDSGSVPFFSPDGKWMAFLTRHGIAKVQVEGGVAIPVASFESSPPPNGASWGKNGDIVFGLYSGNSGLSVAASNGGAIRAVTKADSAHGETSQRWPQVLPDGKTVLYTSWHSSNENARIGIASLETGECTVLDVAGTYAFGVIENHLIYARSDGAIIAIPVDIRHRRVSGDPVTLATDVAVGGRGPAKAALSASGTLAYETGSVGLTRLVLLDRAGKEQTLVPDLGMLGSGPRFSPDGQRVVLDAFPASGPPSDIWIYALKAGTRLRLTPQDTINDLRPEWTPDGKRVLYVSTNGSGGPASVWWQPSDGSGSPQLLQTAKPAKIYDAIISRDGRILVYTVNPSPGALDIWYRSLTGDTTPKPLLNSPALEAMPALSPDGHWLAYVSTESGSEEVYVRAFPGPAGKSPVSSGGGRDPQWTPDGREIVYRNGRTFMSAKVQTSPTFAVQNRTVLFSVASGGGSPHRAHDLSPDGKQLLMLRSNDSTGGIVVVANWLTEFHERIGKH